MKWLALVACASGCLADYDRPPGGGRTIRHQALVADIMNDGFDDIVLIGHDDDPRTGSYMYMYSGSSTGLSVPTKLQLAANAPSTTKWYEPLDIVLDRVPATIHPPRNSLVVLAAQDDAVIGVPAKRTVVASRLPITAGGIDIANREDTDPIEASVGGYASSAPAFVVSHTTSDGSPELVFGGPGHFEWSIDGSVHPASLADESEANVATVSGGLNPSYFADENQYLLLVGSDAVYLSVADGPSYDTARQLPIPGGDHIVRWRERNGEDWGVITSTSAPATLTLIDYYVTGDIMSGTTFLAFTLPLPKPTPTDVALYVPPAGGNFDLVAIESGDLAIYEDITTHGDNPVTFAHRAALPLPDDGYDLLAVGSFGGAGDVIYVIDSSDFTRSFVCYTYATGTIERCP